MPFCTLRSRSFLLFFFPFNVSLRGPAIIEKFVNITAIVLFSIWLISKKSMYFGFALWCRKVLCTFNFRFQFNCQFRNMMHFSQHVLSISNYSVQFYILKVWSSNLPVWYELNLNLSASNELPKWHCNIVLDIVLKVLQVPLTALVQVYWKK